MSMNELETKCRELRQLQALIEEAQAEAEAIKDAIKAHMCNAETAYAGEYKITWKAVTASRIDTTALKRPCPMWPRLSPARPLPAASSWHKKSPLHHRRPKHDAKSPPPGGGTVIIASLPLRVKNKEEYH